MGGDGRDEVRGGEVSVSRAGLLAVVIALAMTQTFAAKPLVQTPIEPVKVVDKGGGKFFVDFGQASFGGLELTIAKPQAGEKLVVRLGEKLAGEQQIDRKPPGSVRFLETSITLEEGKKTYRVRLGPKDARLMPENIGAVMPFRYVELENAPKEFEIRQLMAHYEFDDSAAEFECSDEKLNAIWNISKHTIKATSFAGIFVDGDRERLPYEADAYINQLGWYYCTSDTTLPRLTHEHLITHPTWPTEWIMFSVLIAWEDYQFTGDKASVEKFYDDLKAKTLSALARDDGLISTADAPAEVLKLIHFNGKLKDIVDWPLGERDGYDMKPINTVVNAFHCSALELMSRMAEACGKLDDAAQFKKNYQRALKSFDEKLVDPTTKLYIDGEGSSHSSLHANMFPLAFDLVPPHRREVVRKFVESRGMACSVYGAQFLMDALFDNGGAQHAIDLMIAPGDRSWRHMVEDVGTTMTLEAWDQKYKPNQDWNHAWGAAPANVLPRKVLGVEPLEAGFKKVLIHPRPGKLSWAKGKVPTVRGPVIISWKNGDKFQLTVELPPQTSGQVELPDGRIEQIGAGKSQLEAQPR